MNINLLSLEYFLEMVSAGSISAAARNLYVSQQSLSEHLKKLEAHYKTPLVIRSTPLTLTPSGVLLAEAGRQMFAIQDKVASDIGNLSGFPTLTLGLSIESMPPFLGDIVDSLESSYGEVVSSVNIRRVSASDALPPDDVELLLGSPPFHEKMEYIMLVPDMIAVAVAPTLMRATYGKQWESVSQGLNGDEQAKQLALLPFVRYSRGGSGPWLPYLNAGMLTDNSELAHNLCISGRYAMLLPYDLAKRTYPDDEKMRVYPIKGTAGRLGLAIAYRKGQKLSLPAKEFIATARAYFGR